MKRALAAQAIRRVARSIRGFRGTYIRSTDAQDTLFEFATMLALVARITVAAGGARAAVVSQGTGRFARKPGQRGNFNFIRIGVLRAYFGVEFQGASGALHAPDVVLAFEDRVGLHPLVVVECKHYPNGALPRHVTDAFAGVLIDLRRPHLVDASRQDALPGVRYVEAHVIHDPGLASIISRMVDAGWSFLETTCRGAPREHDMIGRQYGFIIHTLRSANRLT